MTSTRNFIKYLLSHLLFGFSVDYFISLLFWFYLVPGRQTSARVAHVFGFYLHKHGGRGREREKGTEIDREKEVVACSS